MIEENLQALINTIKNDRRVRAIGMAGDQIPKPGESDIDLFVLCAEVPEKIERKEMYSKVDAGIEPLAIAKMEDPYWGSGDYCLLDGVETWVLYNLVDNVRQELGNVLTGEYHWRKDNYFYPLGRCAMWRRMRVLYDPDQILHSFKERLTHYPESLKQSVLTYHIPLLHDFEDLERAVRREDLLFYHFSLDLAVDHFLQVLFAINDTFFPSRKRSEQYIHDFQLKPHESISRLHKVIKLAGEPATLAESYKTWKCLVVDLDHLICEIAR